LLPFQELGKTSNFLMSFFPIIIIIIILGRNVALTSFVGKIVTIVAKRYGRCNQVHHFSP
jgi:hypothetical protein